MLWELELGECSDALSIPVCLHHNLPASQGLERYGKTRLGCPPPSLGSHIHPDLSLLCTLFGFRDCCCEGRSRWVSWKRVPLIFFLTGRSWRFMKASPSLFNAKALQLVSFDLL